MAERSHKTCTKCKVSKALDSYAKSSSTSDGLYTQCRECTAARRKAYYEANRELVLDRNKASYHKTKSYETERARTLRKYGLTLESYDSMLDSQGGACKGCKFVPPVGINLQVDHDHGCCPGVTSCGKCIRGLLCMKCNTILGKAGDNPAILRALAEYLEGGDF